MKVYMVLTFDKLNNDSGQFYGPFSSYSRAEKWAQNDVDDNGEGAKAIIQEIEGDVLEYVERCGDCGCVMEDCECSSDDDEEEEEETQAEAEEDIFS